jgi:hypothetical protein
MWQVVSGIGVLLEVFAICKLSGFRPKRQSGRRIVLVGFRA